MKLYRPVLIESAEQAEALPKGAVVFDGDPEDGDTYVRAGGDWHTNGHPGVLSEALDLGFTVTALVPIEAEEEWTAMGSDNGEPWIAHVGHDGIDGTREEAQQYVDRFGGFIAHRTRTPWEEAQ